MKALILAAGYGTRLYPITRNKPKPLLEVNRKPILNYLLDKLTKIDQLNQIFVVTNHKFFDDYKGWSGFIKALLKNKTLEIIDDGTNSPRERLGAVGDMRFVIQEKNIDEDILVVGGDNIFNFDLQDFINFAQLHKPYSSIGLFDIKDKKEAKRFGVVNLNGTKRILNFQEKPSIPKSSLIAMCFYYFPKESLHFINEFIRITQKQDTPGSYIKWLSKKQAVYGYIFSGEWHDVGHIRVYQEVQGIYGQMKPKLTER